MPSYYESPEEIKRIFKRRELRQKLQSEFNRTYYNPYRFSQHVEMLDPAVARYTAMRSSIYEYWKPNWNSFWKWALITYVPIICLSLNYWRQYKEVHRKCNSGEMPYEKREFRRI